MTWVKRFIPLLFLLAGYQILLTNLNTQRSLYLEKDYINLTLPSQFTGPMALEFKGLTSDILLFKFMTFVGSRTDKIATFGEEQWGHINTTLQTITDLDPYFWDAYLFAEMFLALQAGRIKDANHLLQKARKNIPNEWRVPFYIGFNHYYFQKDYKQAAAYFMEASKLPGAQSYLANLAARLTVFTNQHQVGIIFLEEMITETNDNKMKASLEKRLLTLKMMAFLNDKVTLYREKMHTMPKTLNELITAEIISELPQDPYGGEFILLQNGQIYTTSKLLQQ